MATYSKVDKDVDRMLGVLAREHHADLVGAGVTILVMYAYAPRNKKTGEPEGPALSRNNWPVAAKVKINSLKDRVAGMTDATILLDGDNWEEWYEERQRATLDHELTHLEVKRKDGRVDTDDAGRPKLKMVPHSFEVCGFNSICERYGTASHEGEAADLLSKRLSQKEFAFT